MKSLVTVGAALALAFSTVTLADKTAGQTVDDSTIQAELKTKLMGDNFFKGLGINIEVRKGVVEVDNRLHLKEGKASMGRWVDDKLVTTSVKSELGHIGSGSSLFKVNVDTYNGVVLLTGFADSEEVKAKAGDLAKGTDNVTRVINGIHVLD